MKHKEFVAWLEGYLYGCSISDAQIEKVMKKAKEVEPDVIVQWRDYPYVPAGPYQYWPYTTPPTWISTTDSPSYTFRVDCGGTMTTDGTITYDNKAPHTLT